MLVVSRYMFLSNSSRNRRISFIPLQSRLPQHCCHQDPRWRPHCAKSCVSRTELGNRVHTIVICHKCSQTWAAIVIAPRLDACGVKFIHLLSCLGVEWDVHRAGFYSIPICSTGSVFPQHKTRNRCRIIWGSYYCHCRIRLCRIGERWQQFVVKLCSSLDVRDADSYVAKHGSMLFGISTFLAAKVWDTKGWRRKSWAKSWMESLKLFGQNERFLSCQW